VVAGTPWARSPGGDLSLAYNESAPMNPASTMKLLTTYGALSLLGPAFQWRTEVLATALPRGGRLDGDLVLKGSGDPSLVIERFWLLVQRLRSIGIRQIRGDLVLDKSAFDAQAGAGGSLDGNELRPYNVAPDALLVNFKTVSFEFVPDPAARVARVIATPALAGMKVPATVPISAGACGDWHEKLRGDFSHPWVPSFAGRFPLECGPQTWHVSLLDHSQFTAAAFRSLWEAGGGSWTGKVREAPVPAEARLLVWQDSPPLAEVVRDINKFSNNVMSRQLFLTLGTGGTEPGANAARSIRALTNWLQREDLAMPELVLENGCGLSRHERISAASLSRLLRHAYAGARMPEFMASLPVAGLDGTMKHRMAASGSAYVKTGLLDGVRALAGYVLADSGHRYVVVAIVNHANADSATAALDALLQWVQERG
jgi:serine-type D-Ala-D-Ala carboxypeptidase/endopeptidase (penicillin-binding protein 4)